MRSLAIILVMLFVMMTYVECIYATEEMDQKRFLMRGYRGILWGIYVDGKILYEPVQILDKQEVVLAYYNGTMDKTQIVIIDINTGEILSGISLDGERKIIKILLGDSIYVVFNDTIMKLQENLSILWMREIPRVIDVVLTPEQTFWTRGMVVLHNNTLAIYNKSNGLIIGNYTVENPICVAVAQKPQEIIVMTRNGTLEFIGKDTRYSVCIEEEYIYVANITICDIDRNEEDDIVVSYLSKTEKKIVTIMNNRTKIVIEPETTPPSELVYAIYDINGDGYSEVIYPRQTFPPTKIGVYDIINNIENIIYMPDFAWYAYMHDIVPVLLNRTPTLLICSGGHIVGDMIMGGTDIVAITGESEIIFINTTNEMNYYYSTKILPIENTTTIIVQGEKQVVCIDTRHIIHNVYRRCTLSMNNMWEVDKDNDLLTNTYEKQIKTNPEDPDTDKDNMPDGWEYLNKLNPLNPEDSTEDYDGDGLSNVMEYIHGGDPWNNDTDSDGLNDLQEVQLDTCLRSNDTDGDGMPDGWEVEHELDPLVDDSLEDSDNDGLTNLAEYQHRTNPNSDDTDGDGMPDGWEVTYSLDPLHDDSRLDADNDDLSNADEYTHTTNPIDNDTDDDGMLDGWEVQYGLNPLHDDSSLDTDGDSLSNIDEYRYGTDPTDPDTDGDGYSDGYEVSHGTDPLDPNDYPVSLVRRYWWVPVVCIIAIAVLIVFLYRRRVLVERV